MSEKANNDLGWVKLYRKLKDHPRFKDGDWVKLNLFLLLSATHKPQRVVLDGEVKDLLPGQLITSRKSLAEKLGFSESKAERLLKCLETEHQIEQHGHAKCRVITILKWELYQKTEQVIEQLPNTNRTATEHQPNTHKNDKNDKNDHPPTALAPLFDLPRIEEVLAEASLRSYKKDDAEMFFHHFEAKGWVDGNGIPIRKWRSKMATWMAGQRQRDFQNRESGEVKQIQEGIKIKRI